MSHSINEDLLKIAKIKFNINYDIIRLTNSYGYPALPTSDCWWLVVNDLCKSYVDYKKIIKKNSIPVIDMADNNHLELPLKKAIKKLLFVKVFY